MKEGGRRNVSGVCHKISKGIVMKVVFLKTSSARWKLCPSYYFKILLVCMLMYEWVLPCF